jgi:hypothetical protein
MTEVNPPRQKRPRDAALDPFGRFPAFSALLGPTATEPAADDSKRARRKLISAQRSIALGQQRGDSVGETFDCRRASSWHHDVGALVRTPGGASGSLQ